MEGKGKGCTSFKAFKKLALLQQVTALEGIEKVAASPAPSYCPG